jgi:hypothetical protein
MLATGRKRHADLVDVNILDLLSRTPEGCTGFEWRLACSSFVGQYAAISSMLEYPWSSAAGHEFTADKVRTI